MPDLDGFTLIASLHNDPATRHIPVVVLTAHDLTAQDKSRLNGKVTGVMVKLALTVVAGVGGVVALVVAYRRQAVIEEENERARATARRDDTRLLNERFNSATMQLGHERAAVRAAAVYAVTGLPMTRRRRGYARPASASCSRICGSRMSRSRRGGPGLPVSVRSARPSWV